MILTETIKSLRTGKIYGEEGDEVTVISERGDTVIVERNGETFSVQKSKLK